MIAVAPTDSNWFAYFRNTGNGTFINFWTPTPWNVKKLRQGDRFYFLLKAPVRKLGGFGEFVKYMNRSARDVWDEFGNRTGCYDFNEFIMRVSNYVKKNAKSKFVDPENYVVGCVVLSNCEFWSENEYKRIDIPTQVVKHKYFEEDFLKEIKDEIGDFQLVQVSRTKIPVSSSGRIAQSRFSSSVFCAYKNTCCISGETCIDLLHAGHIQPYINLDSQHPQNGLLMRVDLHTLYDRNLLFIDATYRVHISKQIRSEYYKSLDGSHISLPFDKKYWPSPKALELKRAAFR